MTDDLSENIFLTNFNCMLVLSMKGAVGYIEGVVTSGGRAMCKLCFWANAYRAVA